jgi:hypothetical protein
MAGGTRRTGGGEANETDLPALYGPGLDDPETVTTSVLTSGRGSRLGFEGSPIELSVVRRRGVSHTDASEQWVALEIWTEHRIYLLTQDMRCVRVHDIREGKDDTSHTLLGATLTGGQHRGKEQVELSQPLPLPGMKAVFRAPGQRNKPRFVMTSKVERVVLRLGLTSLENMGPDRAFHELTARFFMPSS